MATKLEIYNMALGLIGVEKLSLITDNTKGREVCDTFYSNAVLHLLRSHNWNFATKRATLSSTITPAFEYKYGIAKPADCLRVISFNNYSDSFKEEGGYILTNQSSVQAKYIRNDVAEADFDASFVTALSSKLAELICYQLTQSSTLLQLIDARHKSDIAMARRNNAISTTIDDFQSATWLASRL